MVALTVLERLLRPYMAAMLLLAATDLLMVLMDHYLVRYGFSWALVSLLVISAVASLWGTGPAILVLVLSALFGDMVAPDLHISYFYGPHLPWDTRLVRTSLFSACGFAIIWLQRQSRVLRIKGERKQAALHAMQDMVLPDSLAQASGWERAYLYRPAHEEEEVGGDFYDFFPLGREHTYGVMIGDVMGKGMEAASNTALLRYSIRAFASMGCSPAEILSRLNALVDAQNCPTLTTTLFFGILQTHTGSLCYASAGHEPPIVCREDGSEEDLEPTGPILGIGGWGRYTEATTVLNEGDTLLLMTDGVTEARNERGEFLDTIGARRMLRPLLREGSMNSILDRFSKSLLEYMGSHIRDDIALLLLRRTDRDLHCPT